MTRGVAYTVKPTWSDCPAPTVQTRANWTDSWSNQKFLYVDHFVECANPEIPSAQLTWRYGRLCRPTETKFGEVDPLDNSLIGQFVKISLNDPANPNNPARLWYGVINSIVDVRDGSPIIGGGSRKSGKQTVQCQGLVVLLERQQVSQSTIAESDGSENAVGRGIQFNEYRQFKEIGNRSIAQGERDAFVFTHDLQTAKFWTTADAVDYLLAYQAPADPQGNVNLPWSISAGTFSNEIWWDKPIVAAEKRTVKQLLDQLLDRRRLLGYVAHPSIDEDRMLVDVFTYNQAAVTFNDGTIPANSDQIDLDIDESPDVLSCQFRRTSADQFDQVVVRGARITSCFTVSFADDTLVAGWDTGEQSDYNAAASGAGDYPAAAEIADRITRNEMYRRQDRLKKVYRYFNLPPGWNGMVNENEGGSVPFLPDPDDGTIPREVWVAALRFERHLPLKTDHDYSGTKIANNSVTDNTPDGTAWEYLPMFSIAKFPKRLTDIYGGGRYQYMEQFACNAKNEIANPIFSANVRPQEDCAGFILDGVSPPELVANATFTPADASDFNLDDYASINWKTQMLATVAIQTDWFAEGRYPADGQVSGGLEIVRTLFIDAGNDARYDYVAPGTVVGVKDGNLIQSTSGGAVRDDTPKLQEIAQAAFNWYSQPRQVLELEMSLIAFDLAIGQLITTLDDAAINTVITRLVFEFPESGGEDAPSPRTRITTQAGQLDQLFRDVSFDRR